MADAATVYARQVEVLWRLAADRVLVRRPWPKNGQVDAADLLGMAALVWLALDEPCTMREIGKRLADAHGTSGQPELDLDLLGGTVERLLETGWIEFARP